MSEVAQIRAKIAETETEIAKTEAKIKDAENAGDFARRDRLEALQISLVDRLRGLEEDLRRKKVSTGSGNAILARNHPSNLSNSLF
jgi:predicted  nucleic acid-binding Zn-ribbon protein